MAPMSTGISTVLGGGQTEGDALPRNASETSRTSTKRPRENDDDDGRGAGRAVQPCHFIEHFTDPEVDNLRVREVRAVMSPQMLLAELPMTHAGKDVVVRGRREVTNILHGLDDRLLVVAGPCSVHDPEAAREYALRLKAEKDRFLNDICLVMRVFVERPFAPAGWKGLINDPALDQSYMVNTGLRAARKLLQEVNHVGIPCAVEFLDTTTPQYLADLVAWGCIGERTAESQLHCEMASGLSMPVGIQNNTNSDISATIDACIAATHPQCFFGSTKQGTTAIVHSFGNADAHLVLRDRKAGRRHRAEDVSVALNALSRRSELVQAIVLDCSHGGSASEGKGPAHVFEETLKEVCGQLGSGQRGIAGVMLKSNLVSGSQALPQPTGKPDFGHRSKASAVGEGTGGDLGEQVRSKLRFGVSVTDTCIDWTTTVKALEDLSLAVQRRRNAVTAARAAQSMTQ
mmetsp:Transcript_50073/g.140399  ORF Transcript_50073/g.140399 Transcript_50073/m.140399 type:complete len:459 (-) Transcript_50073:72-1448(-)|eukprot:CAMPEP_0117503734 /NCGR_PEP_ID=MMETSP0784-20121206/24486_1 /TAXON_ID=39447 /ORGANISM="" /LENGTH=458 /DNA_ID=CAMNT_0005299067 /DNA_START=54 /DNA_END=1430 /DNA_ORIENTATION=-